MELDVIHRSVLAFSTTRLGAHRERMNEGRRQGDDGKATSY